MPVIQTMWQLRAEGVNIDYSVAMSREETPDLIEIDLQRSMSKRWKEQLSSKVLDRRT